MDRRLRELLEVYSTGAGSEQCGSPYLSLASSGCHSSTAVQAVLPVDVFGRSKDAASSTTLNHSLVKRASPRIPKANEQREGVSTTPSYHRDMLLVSRPPNRRAKSYDKACASRDDCRPTIQPRGGAVDPITLRVTAALPPIPSSDVSPAIQDTEVASTDDNSLDAKVASTDANFLDTEVVSTDDDSQDAEVASTDDNSQGTGVVPTDDDEESRFRQHKLEQIFQALPQLVVVQHHPSGSKPSRFSKGNGTQPPYNRRSHADPPIKASICSLRSRTPLIAAPDRLAAISNSYKVDSGYTKVTTAGVPSSVLLSRIGLRDDKRNVAKPTLRSGKSIAVRNEPEQANTWDTTK
ncbi:hypothetical protein BC936DRAFT_145526 [Jimgerdemannia flammicorona]|uniref:Uncharacterized protein n=1 Tax=Jimgerdemannia flammicorona TaxID=994334 RepID=A0A433D9S0_9FUNG|nr:hypothetical protein BC936DRAFT_145526 [Jimgerdemannia flammicorona]